MLQYSDKRASGSSRVQPESAELELRCIGDMIERKSNHNVAELGSERERVHKRAGREWALSVSKGTMQRRRTPHHFLDFLAWVF